MVTGKALRALRMRRGLTLRELGALSGLSGDDIARYERGEVQPRKENTAKLAAALGEAIDTIRDGLCWTEAETPEPWELQDGKALLRQGVLQALEEAYGTVEACSFRDSRGVARPCFIVGAPPDSFPLYEQDIAALEEAVTTAAAPLAEHMKDTRPGKEIDRDILQGLRPPALEEDRCGLTDEQWARVKDLLPSEKAGKGRAFKDNRLMLDGILYWLQTGVPWRDLPERFGRSRCVYDRLRLWNDTGVWPKVLAKLLELRILEENSIVVDSTHFK